MNIGEQIGALRREKGLTQERLGEAVNVTGQAVSKWEKGESLPDISLLPSLCAALGVGAGALLGVPEGVLETPAPEAAYFLRVLSHEGCLVMLQRVGTGAAPTRDELAAETGMSPDEATRALLGLMKRGMVCTGKSPEGKLGYLPGPGWEGVRQVLAGCVLLAKSSEN